MRLAALDGVRRAGIAALAMITCSMTPTSAAETNPLLAPSPLPFGYPVFDQIKTEHFVPAYEAGFAEELKEIDAISKNPEKPSFGNTLVALQRAGQLRASVDRTFSNLVGVNSSPEMRAIEKQMSPRLAAHRDTIRMNPALFARIDELFNHRADLHLNPEDDRLLERVHADFVRSGAKLSEADKASLRAINAELATLETRFSQNVLNESNASGLVVDTAAELKGLTESQIAAAADAAKAAGKAGKYLIRLMNTTGQPPLASLENRTLRERLLKTSLERCSHGGEYDNRATVARLAELRLERARLLGYPTHAAYVLEEQTALTVDAVNSMLSKLTPPAVANARREAADMQAIIDGESGGFQLAAWDWAYYAEKVRRARYAFDESELRPYFEVNRVLQDGVFFAAGKLYGLRFQERKDLPVYDPDVRVFDVLDADGSPLALFLVDLYARPTKRGGAWMSAYVQQSRLLGTKPVIANHLNIPKPPAGEPTLMTFDEVTTMFHEFGHALHGMFSNVTYPRFSGTSVPRDFVEFPSQVNEMWAVWPEVLANYAKHYQTGAPIPAELVAKLKAAETFNQGFMTTEYLAAVLLDQAWHQLTPGKLPQDVLVFEAASLARAGVDFPPVPPRYRSTYFSHVFSNSYSAGYYSYIWAEVLDADTVDWFKAHGGLTRQNGDRLRTVLLSRGGSVDAMALFREFYGSEPEIGPLLKRRGLEAPASAAN
ncbi:dipeptidyl carboxypeptidase II [Opitutaceae bacterium EW11]|nr:dipeptidyl carboxypeptidase II [Opitutaceae bacterium EW11]